jgi:hypothetical protein
VTMNDDAEGQAAIKALDGKQFGGRAAREDRAFVAVLGTQCHGLTHRSLHPLKRSLAMLVRKD